MTKRSQIDRQSEKISWSIWDRHFRDFSFPKKGNFGASEFLTALNMPGDVPNVVKKIVQIGDELDMKLRCDVTTPLTRQWNALSGNFYFDTNVIPGSGGDLSISDLMNFKAKGLYVLTHEAAHVIGSELGLRGLLHKTNDKSLSSSPWRFSVMMEAFAEFVSHYELGIATFDYWQRYWKPIAERSEAQNSNAGIAAFRAGLKNPPDRAELILSIYFRYNQTPAPLTMKTLLQSDEFLDIWNTQRGYARKSVTVSESWWYDYWNCSSLNGYIEEFIPKEAAPVWLQSLKEPLMLNEVEDVGLYFDKLLYDWKRPPDKINSYLSARRVVQRSALAVCQAFRLLNDTEPRLTAAQREKTRDCLETARALLLRNYNDLGGIWDGANIRFCNKTQHSVVTIVDQLVRQLVRISGPVVKYQHSAVPSKEIGDDLVGVDLGYFESLKTGKKLSSPVYFLDKSIEILGRLEKDLLLVASMTPEDHNVFKVLRECGTFRVRLVELKALRSYKNVPSLKRELVKWYAATIKRNSLVSCYRWSWLRDLPHLDPLNRFRVT